MPGRAARLWLGTRFLTVSAAGRGALPKKASPRRPRRKGMPRAYLRERARASREPRETCQPRARVPPRSRGPTASPRTPLRGCPCQERRGVAAQFVEHFAITTSSRGQKLRNVLCKDDHDVTCDRAPRADATTKSCRRRHHDVGLRRSLTSSERSAREIHITPGVVLAQRASWGRVARRVGSQASVSEEK